MRRILALIAVVLTFAVPASAQYPGPGYPPSGGGGGAPSFPLLPASTLDCSAPSYSWSDAPLWGLCRTTSASAQFGAQGGSNSVAYGLDLGSGFFTYFSNGSNGITNIVQSSASGFLRLQSTDTSPSSSGTIDLEPGTYSLNLTQGSNVHTQSLSVAASFSTITDGVSTMSTSTFLTSLTIQGTNSGSKSASFTLGTSVTPAASMNASNATISTVAAADTNGIWLSTEGSKPACTGVGQRGYLWRTAGGAGVADTFEACLKDSTDTYAWRSMVGVLP